MLRPNSLDVFGDKKCLKSFKRYFGILEDCRRSQFQLSKMLEANYNEDDSDKTLWQLHKVLTEEYVKFLVKVDDGVQSLKDQKKPFKSYFDLKIALAHRTMKGCKFCHRTCGVDRTTGARGYC